MCFQSPNANNFFSDLPPTTLLDSAGPFDDSSASDLWSEAEREANLCPFESNHSSSGSTFDFINDDVIEPLRVDLPAAPGREDNGVLQERLSTQPDATYSGNFHPSVNMLASQNQIHYQAATSSQQHTFDTTTQGSNMTLFSRNDYSRQYETRSADDQSYQYFDGRQSSQGLPDTTYGSSWQHGYGMSGCWHGEVSGDCKIYVDHTYADFSSVNDGLVHERSVFVGETLESIIDKGGATVPEDVVTVEPVTNRGTRTFPKKLMEMLSLPEVSHCLTWQPHGRSFVVNNPEAFMTEVYPKFFKATQYKSFLRQLNLWGFKRITKGPDNGSYYHQFFLRGMPNLVKKMTLVRIKGGARPMPNPRDEPDFYALASFRPLPTI